LPEFCDKLRASIEKISPHAVDEILPLQTFGNSNTYSIKCANGHRYFLKRYLFSNSDLRNRQETERNALIFLNKNTNFSTPQFIGGDLQTKINLFEWIEGHQVIEPSERDIMGVLDFIGHLSDISHGTARQAFSLASEACLSPPEVIRQISERISNLQNASNKDTDLLKLLETDLCPIYDKILTYTRENNNSKIIWRKQKIAATSQVLCPSDLGFNNILRQTDGKLVFVDFEYFGWDDPVKMIADFLLHPAHRLKQSQKKIFFNESKNIFSNILSFSDRFNSLLPFFEIRWCLIILNPFCNDYRLDRGIELTPQLKRQRLSEVQKRLTNLLNWYKTTDYGK
jgi:thiamine kinase-like enzyme